MTQATQHTVQHIAAWFEIPVANFSRAKQFYESTFDTQLKEEAMGDMKMGVFAHAQEAISGCILSSPFAKPSMEGSVIYIYTQGDLQQVLDRAKKQGSQVFVPKTALPPEAGGYFAVMSDSEGNKVGLYSLQ